MDAGQSLHRRPELVVNKKPGPRPSHLCSQTKEGPVCVFSWPGKGQATFPVKQRLTSCSVPVPLVSLSPTQSCCLSRALPVSLEQHLSVKLLFPSSSSHLLSCLLILTSALCPALPLISSWKGGDSHAGCALTFCGQCWSHQVSFSHFKDSLPGQVEKQPQV